MAALPEDKGIKNQRKAFVRRRSSSKPLEGRATFFSVKVFRMDLEADFKRLFGVVF